MKRTEWMLLSAVLASVLAAPIFVGCGSSGSGSKNNTFTSSHPAPQPATQEQQQRYAMQQYLPNTPSNSLIVADAPIPTQANFTAQYVTPYPFALEGVWRSDCTLSPVYKVGNDGKFAPDMNGNLIEVARKPGMKTVPGAAPRSDDVTRNIVIYFNQGRFWMNQYTYADPACGQIILIQANGTQTIQATDQRKAALNLQLEGTVESSPAGSNNLTIVQTKLNLTLNNDHLVGAANRLRIANRFGACGISNWVKGTEVEISGKTCASAQYDTNSNLVYKPDISFLKGWLANDTIHPVTTVYATSVSFAQGKPQGLMLKPLAHITVVEGGDPSAAKNAAFKASGAGNATLFKIQARP